MHEKCPSTEFFSGLYFPASTFSPNTGKYGPEEAPYLDTFHKVKFHATQGCVENPVQHLR